MENLVANHPKNSLYSLTLSEIYYADGKERASLDLLFSSVLYTPSILGMRFVRELMQADSSFYFSLCHKLSEHILNEPQAPADLARMGYIAHWLNRQEIAKNTWKRLWPYSPIWLPHGCCWEKTKILFIKPRCVQEDYDERHSVKLPDRTKNDLLKWIYQAKFKMWYGEQFEGVLFHEK